MTSQLGYKKFLLSFIILAWIFSGWPKVWNSPPIPKTRYAHATVLCERPSSVTDLTGGNTTWDNNGQSWDTTTCPGPDTTTSESFSSENVNYDSALDWNWSSSGNSYADLTVKVRVTTSNYTKNSWGLRYTTNGTEADTTNGAVLSCTSNCNGLTDSSNNSTNVTGAVFEASLSASQDLTQLKVGEILQKGGGGGDSTADVQIFDVWVEGNEAANISVTITANGTISYGVIAAGGSKATHSGDMNTTITAQNDGDVTENFNIRGQDTTCPWTLAASSGNDQYVHQFCKTSDVSCTSPPTNYTALTTSYQELYPSVAVSGSKNFDLQITLPDPSSCMTSQSVDVTIQAVQT